MTYTKSKKLEVQSIQRRGAMLVFVAIAMVALMGMLTLTLDVGAGNRQRRIAQTAADAGALAGGTQILRGLPGNVITAADSVIVLNGFTLADAVVNYPPAAGDIHAGDSSFVQVIISKTIPSIFGSLFNKNSLDVRAIGVAGAAGASTSCVVSLATTGTGLNLKGDMTATSCSVNANSSDAQAISIASGKEIDAPFVSAVGGITGSVTGTAKGGVPPSPDPFINVPLDTGTTCTFNSVFNVTANITLNPGKYCGGINIDKNNTATFNAGTYIIRGGGIVGGHIIATSGVTILNENGPGNNPAKFGVLNFEQSCSVFITAPLTGPYAGIAIYQDPAGPANAFNSFCGSGTIIGSLYFPTQEFNLGNGNGKLDVAGMIVAKVISEQNGGARLNISAPTILGPGSKKLSLVE
jgi:putative Flp pilus-assembly TadE/G-like protein